MSGKPERSSFRTHDQYVAAHMRWKFGAEMTPEQVREQRLGALMRLREALQEQGWKNLPEDEAGMWKLVQEALEKPKGPDGKIRRPLNADPESGYNREP